MPSANKKSQLRYHSLRTLDSTVFSRHLCKKNPLTCSGHDDGGGPHWGCCRVCGHGATRFTVPPSLLSTVNVSSELRRRCLSRRTRNRRRPRPSNAPRDPPSPPSSLFVPPILPRGRLLLLPSTTSYFMRPRSSYAPWKQTSTTSGVGGDGGRTDRLKRGGERTRTVRLERQYRVALVGNDANSFAFHFATSPDIANSFFSITTD